MKRLTFILLTIAYLFSTLGVSAKSMYCMGVLRSSQISYSVTAKKDTCKMAVRMKNCCKTKKQLLKVKDQHVYSGPFSLLQRLFPVLFNYPDDDAITCASTVLPQQLYYNHAPPEALKIPVYMLNCNYRI